MQLEELKTFRSTDFSRSLFMERIGDALYIGGKYNHTVTMHK